MTGDAWRTYNVSIASGNSVQTQDSCESTGPASELTVTCIPLTITISADSAVVHVTARRLYRGRRNEDASTSATPSASVTTSGLAFGAVVVVEIPDSYGSYLSQSGSYFALRNSASTNTSSLCSLGSGYKDYSRNTLNTTLCSPGAYSLRIVAPVAANVVTPQSSSHSRIGFGTYIGIAFGTVFALAFAAYFIRTTARRLTSTGSWVSSWSSHRSINRVAPDRSGDPASKPFPTATRPHRSSRMIPVLSWNDLGSGVQSAEVGLSSPIRRRKAEEPRTPVRPDGMATPIRVRPPNRGSESSVGWTLAGHRSEEPDIQAQLGLDVAQLGYTGSAQGLPITPVKEHNLDVLPRTPDAAIKHLAQFVQQSRASASTRRISARQRPSVQLSDRPDIPTAVLTLASRGVSGDESDPTHSTSRADAIEESPVHAHPHDSMFFPPSPTRRRFTFGEQLQQQVSAAGLGIGATGQPRHAVRLQHLTTPRGSDLVARHNENMMAELWRAEAAESLPGEGLDRSQDSTASVTGRPPLPPSESLQ